METKISRVQNSETWASKVAQNPQLRNWNYQLKSSVSTLEELQKYITVSPEEIEAIERSQGRYRWSITPYYLSLIAPDDPNCPIRMQSVPQMGQFSEYSQNADPDPVGDTYYRQTARVVHKYPDRIILLVTDTCAVYCQHCTRKEHTTAEGSEHTYFGDGATSNFEPDFKYIREHPEIRDVLLTGGDPLSMSDIALNAIIGGLRDIPSVEIVRLGSRYPVLLPQRITPEFCQMLAKHHPVWLNTHFNHPKEITDEAKEAIAMLTSYGIPVQNQTVLMKGINDDLDTMRSLVHRLLKIHCRPYYLYHCDAVQGVAQFATEIEKGKEIMRGLIGHTTGYAVPQYVLTTKIGKINLMEERSIPLPDGNFYLTNYHGDSVVVDPRGKQLAILPNSKSRITTRGWS